MEDELLSEVTIYLYALHIADGTATPNEARALLVDFVKRCDEHVPVPCLLLEHFADCLRSFLRGNRMLLPFPRYNSTAVPIESLDKAFGLSRLVAGAPPSIEIDTYKEVAMQVLAKRIAGQSLEKASAEIEDERQLAALPVSSDSQIRDAWGKYKLDGYLLLRATRSANANPWSAAEEDKLAKIFEKEPWCPPPFW